MNNIELLEISPNDLILINGGQNDEFYNAGYAVGELLGKMTKNFLGLTGIWKLITLL